MWSRSSRQADGGEGCGKWPLVEERKPRGDSHAAAGEVPAAEPPGSQFRRRSGTGAAPAPSTPGPRRPRATSQTGNSDQRFVQHRRRRQEAARQGKEKEAGFGGASAGARRAPTYLCALLRDLPANLKSGPGGRRPINSREWNLSDRLRPARRVGSRFPGATGVRTGLLLKPQKSGNGREGVVCGRTYFARGRWQGLGLANAGVSRSTSYESGEKKPPPETPACNQLQCVEPSRKDLRKVREEWQRISVPPTSRPHDAGPRPRRDSVNSGQ